MSAREGHTPLTARANRIYTAAGLELAVVTRSEASLRGHTEKHAAMLASAVNSHAALVEALRMALDDCEVCGPDGQPLPISAQTIASMRAALRLARGETGGGL